MRWYIVKQLRTRTMPEVRSSFLKPRFHSHSVGFVATTGHFHLIMYSAVPSVPPSTSSTLDPASHVGPVGYSRRQVHAILLPLSPCIFAFHSPPLPTWPYPSLVDSEHPRSCRLGYCGLRRRVSRSLCATPNLSRTCSISSDSTCPLSPSP